MAEGKSGYTTVTYKFRLYDKHNDWLLETKNLYNMVVKHYYQMLLAHTELLEQSNFVLLRKAEEMTVGTKNMKARGEIPAYSLEGFPKIPLYFRRAAINTAIGLVRSYVGLYLLWQKREQKGNPPSSAAEIHSSPVYYKGMYRDLKEDEISLKLFTGKCWEWVTYSYIGRKLPKCEKLLSPILKITTKEAWIHIPVLQEVKDVSTIQERMEDAEKILAVSFPDSDCMAVCVVLNREGKEKDCRYIRGGAERKQKKRHLIERLEKARKDKNSDCTTIYKKISDLNTQYAHRVSRQIVRYCQENEIKVIAVPNYEKGIDFFQKPYLKTNSYEWIGRRIIEYLKYKAFQEGILVGTIRPYHISDTCSECGAPIQRYNEGHRPSRHYYGGKLYLCPNGHHGNSAWNSAHNIGLQFLKYYQ